MKIRGCYVVWGLDVSPQVHTLTREQVEIMDTRERLATREVAISMAFGRGITERAPAWIDKVMETLALQYEGAHQVAVRGLCAAILTGTPYGGPEPGDRPSGGTPDRKPDQPKSPRGPKGRLIPAAAAA